MYEINRDQTSPVNFFAGDFPVVTEAGDVKSGATVRKYAPVIKTADGISEATADGLPDGRIFRRRADLARRRDRRHPETRFP